MEQTNWRNEIENTGTEVPGSKQKKSKKGKIIMGLIILVIAFGAFFVYNQELFEFGSNETNSQIIQKDTNFSSWVLDGIDKGYAQNLSINIERYISFQSLGCKIITLNYNNTHQTNLINIGCLKVEWQEEIAEEVSKQSNQQQYI